jgi:hypothetical protein
MFYTKQELTLKFAIISNQRCTTSFVCEKGETKLKNFSIIKFFVHIRTHDNKILNGLWETGHICFESLTSQS